MSKIIASAAIRGTYEIVAEAESRWNRARESSGEATKVAFPETAYFLPMIHALMGLEVKTVGEMKPVFTHIHELLPPHPSEAMWLPYLGDTLDAGIATLLAEELIVALR